MVAERLQVLYVAGGPPGGQPYGAESCLLDLVARMDRARFAPHAAIASGPGPYVTRLRALGVTVREACPVASANGCLYWARAAAAFVRAVASAIRSCRPDLIHVNSLRLNPYAVMAAKLSGTPIVCQVHGTVSPRAYWTRAAFAAERIVAVAEAVAAPWRCWRGASRRLRVVYNGVDTRAFQFSEESRSRERQRLGLEDRSFAVGVVSRLSPEKGWEVLFQAVAQRALQTLRMAVLVAGDAPPHLREYGAAVRTMPGAAGIGDRVRFLGYVREVAPLYSAFDAIVLPSYDEAMPRVLLEAMAAERPVIATRVGGVPEVVVDGETGLLLPPHDPEALAHAILRLASDPALCRKMGEAGRKRVEQHFTIDRYVRAMEAVYEEVLEERRGRQWRESR